MDIASNSALLNQAFSNIINGSLALFAIIISACFGGFFAGLWANYFESKRRISEKRRDRYYEHRNTLVQIEQELLPLRVNISRDLASISLAIENTNEENIRLILRFDNLFFSTGLGLKLLNLDFINKYAELYSDIEKFNSDIAFVSGMISSVREDLKNGKVDKTLVESYLIYLPYLRDECEGIDRKSLELLALCKVGIGNNDKPLREKYIKDGKEIKYSINKKSLSSKYKAIKNEEEYPSHEGDKKPQFIAPYLDLKWSE